MDLLKSVQTVLKAALNTIKYSNRILNVERIPDVKALSIKYGFPAVGILDGGETNVLRQTTILKTETVSVAIYVKVIGDQEKCIEELRAIIGNCIFEIRKKEHYRSGGAFEGYSRAWCRAQSEIKQVFCNNDYSPLLLKLSLIDFIKQEAITQ